MRTTLLMMLMAVTISAHAHPLAEAIKSLSRAKVEINNVRNRANNSSATNERIDKIADKLAKVWADAMLISIQQNDSKMVEFGYSFEKEAAPRRFSLQKDDSISLLTNDIANFDSSQWKAFREIIKNELSNLNETADLLNQNEYVGGFNYDETEPIAGIVFSNRKDTLIHLENRANDTVNCIDYFNHVALERGLKLVNQAGNRTWSSEDLNRIYGKNSVQDLSESQRGMVISTIHDMTAKAITFQFACIARPDFAFLVQEKKVLDGGQK